MFALPELYGTRDFLSQIEDGDFQLCKNECIFRQTKPFDPDLYELCNIFMADSNLTLDPYQAVNLCMHLREAIRACV